MELVSIEISNYRSIDTLKIDCSSHPDSPTFGLIGQNEVGKSSILKAIALSNGSVKLNEKDFRDKKEPVNIIFEYRLDKSEAAAFMDYLVEENYADLDVTDVDNTKLKIDLEFEFPAMTKRDGMWLTLHSSAEPSGHYLQNGLPFNFHKAIFWSAEDRYLISKPIELSAFALNPEEVSIPLRNCFLLAGITDISDRVTSLSNDSTEIEHLQTELGRKVTDHIKSVWPNHPIDITFLITNNTIHFHVKDLGTEGKAKTADQRSDGFKQFISFLLTVSAENKNEELSNSILLLDEPETHLHPLAQEYLLGELVKISSNKRGNLVYFATHSNYMIDKHDLSRNYRVSKPDARTKIEQLDKKLSSYASVTYEVFEIANSDYHNELFGRLHEDFIDEDPSDVARETLKGFDEKFFHQAHRKEKNKPLRGKVNAATLPTYIRNCIHHPEAGNKYSDKELKTSIELMRKLLFPK